MPLTPEHNIYYPNAESQFTPLESHFAALATSVDDALIVQAEETRTSVEGAQSAADAALDGIQDLDYDLRPKIVQAQEAADDAWDEAELARGEAFAAANRLDTVEGELDTTAQTAQDAWNLALEATASATQRLNLVPNPSYEDGVDFVSSGSGVAQLTNPTTANAVASGTRAMAIRVEGSGAGGGWVGQTLAGDVGGSWLGVSLVARRSTGPTHARFYVNWAGATGEFFGEMWELPTAANSVNPRQAAAVPVPEGATGATVWLRLYGSSGGIAPLDGVTHTDAWMASWADSEAAALTAVDTYFDGSTPERTDASGILYQTQWTGVPHGSSSVETAYTSAMLDILAEAHAATQAAIVAGGKADNAGVEASTARAEAAAAAGIAEGKADVLIQSNTPTTDMRKPTTLWIDTTNGNNTPKRWSGSAWVAVTDKAVIDAAAAAAAAEAKATQALNAAGGKNTVFRSVSLPGSTQGIAAGDVWWRFAESTLQGPIIGQWTWTGSQWRPATIDSQIIANLTVDKLVVTGGAKFPLAVIDTLVGDEAFISNLATNQVVVGPANLAPPFTAESSWDVFRGEFAVSSRSVTGRSLQFDGTSGLSGSAHSPIFSVVGGQEYWIRTKLGRLGNSYATGGRWYLGLRVVTAEGDHVSYHYPLSAMTESASWDTEYSGSVVLPTTAQYARIRIVFEPPTGTPATNAHTTFYDIVVERKVGSILLGEGAVTAPSMSAGALDAFQITSPNIRSTATANRGIKWNGDQLIGYTNTGAQAFHLDGTRATITGGTIQTSATANRGVKILSTGLLAYDNSGNEMIRLVGDTGAITGVTITGGRVQTAASGARLLLTNSTAGFPSLWMYDNTNSGHRVILQTNASGALFAFADGTGQDRLRMDASGTMWMWAPNGQQSFRMYTNNDTTFGRVWLEGPEYVSNRAQIMMGRQTVDGTNSSTVRVNSGSVSDQAYLQVAAGGSWFLGSNTRGRVYMDNSSGELSLYPRSNLLSFYGLPTTGSTGQPITMIISGTGRPSIYRNTSVRAAKTHIEDLDVDPYKVLDLQPRTFYDRNAWERYANALTVEYDREHDQEPDPEIAVHEGTQYPDRLVGFIAEEVEELFPELVSYDEQGNLVGVQYDRVAGHLLLAVRALKTEIDNMKEDFNE